MLSNVRSYLWIAISTRQPLDWVSCELMINIEYLYFIQLKSWKQKTISYLLIHNYNLIMYCKYNQGPAGPWYNW